MTVASATLHAPPLLASGCMCITADAPAKQIDERLNCNDSSPWLTWADQLLQSDPLAVPLSVYVTISRDLFMKAYNLRIWTVTRVLPPRYNMYGVFKRPAIDLLAVKWMAGVYRTHHVRYGEEF